MSDSDEKVEEEFVPEDEQDVGPAALARLREKLKKAVEEKQEYLDGWQRARADFANFKKEEATLHGDKEERIKADLVEALLPAFDALELAVRHDAGKNPELAMLERQFTDALKKFGVERFGAAGEPFDPRRHEALAQKGDGGKVEVVERSGYTVGDKVIRAAQVII
jgi:molecular chaperone GrpE